MLTILDEQYNNVKALEALNQELFQLWMADKETILDWGICLLKYLQVLAASFPDRFPPDHVGELKRDCFYGGLPKQLSDGNLPEGRATGKNLLRLPKGHL